MIRVLHGVPTIPQNYLYMIERFIPSLVTTKELLDRERKYEYTLHIYAQGLTEDQYRNMQKVCDDVGISAVITEAEFKSMDNSEGYGNRLKNRAKTFLKGVDYYIMTDDDFEFVDGSFEAYAKCLDYLVDNPACCSVMCTGYMGSGGKDQTPQPYRGLTWTNRGLVLRNMENDLPELYTTCISNEMLNNMDKVFFDDWAVALHPITQGYYSAKQFKNPTRHYHISPPITEEKINKIPKHSRNYFSWKICRQSVYTIDQWKACDDYPFFKEIFQLPNDFDLTHAKIAKHIWQSDKFINNIYKPAAITRFGSSRY